MKIQINKFVIFICQYNFLFVCFCHSATNIKKFQPNNAYISSLADMRQILKKQRTFF